MNDLKIRKLALLVMTAMMIPPMINTMILVLV